MTTMATSKLPETAGGSLQTWAYPGSQYCRSDLIVQKDNTEYFIISSTSELLLFDRVYNDVAILYIVTTS